MLCTVPERVSQGAHGACLVTFLVSPLAAPQHHSSPQELRNLGSWGITIQNKCATDVAFDSAQEVPRFASARLLGK